MSVYFFINDIHNVGSITVKQALHIGQNFSQYVIKKDDAEYEEFLKEKLSSFECILLGIEKKSARGFELSYDNNTKTYEVRILSFSSVDDYLAAFDYIKKLCSFLGCTETITDDNESYTINNLQTYPYKENIKHELAAVYSKLLKSSNNDAYFEFQGIHRKVTINVDLLENVIINAENVVEKFSTFVTGLQYINAYEARQKFYENDEGTIIGIYAITETVPTILPFNPSVESENQDMVTDNNIAEWIINLVVINGNPEDKSSYENLGQINYQEFINRLPKEKYGFIDARYILVQPLSNKELRQILGFD